MSYHEAKAISRLIPKRRRVRFAEIPRLFVDDVADVHFVAVTALHVTYVYCCSLLKVFESRENSIGGKPTNIISGFSFLFKRLISKLKDSMW